MDLLWTDDMDLFAAETSSEYDEVVQDCYHAIEQDLGSNPDDPTRGLGVANILSKSLPNSLTKSAEAELQKDDRVISARAALVTDAQGSTTLDIQISVDGDELDVSVPVVSTQSGVSS